MNIDDVLSGLPSYSPISEHMQLTLYGRCTDDRMSAADDCLLTYRLNKRQGKLCRKLCAAIATIVQV